MNGIQSKIIQGDFAALKLVKSTLTTPTLINKDPTQGVTFAVPLECETYQQTGNAQVSESLVICKQNKVNVSDNVAPGAWSWNMSGYIPGSPAEVINLFTPMVRLNASILRSWFKQGTVLIFKDIDAEIHKRVVIQTLTISQVKDCRNVMPFTMTVKEINVMDDELANITTTIQSAMPKVGSKLGKALGGGATIAQTALPAVVKGITALIQGEQINQQTEENAA